MESLSMRIGASWRPGRRTFASVDPYTGHEWITAPDADEQDVIDAVQAARYAFDEGPWPRMAGAERAKVLRRLADLIEANADDLALCETRDNGKLLREMRDQVLSLPAWYRYFGDLADKIDGRIVDTGRTNFMGLVLREPLGVIAAILPWNSPLLLMTFKVAPALAVGCTVVVKPSEQAPAGILRFAELTERAGLPPGVFNTVSGLGKDVGQWLASSERVDKVAFTGSGEVGRKIAAQAAEHLAPVSLELGAKSANIVFADSDVDAAVSGLLSGIFAAAGQSCVAGSRALIQRSVADEVLDKLVARTREIVLGDPTDAGTQMGPIAFPQHLDRINGFMKRARDDGAEVLVGGETDAQRPQFFPRPFCAACPSNPRCAKRRFSARSCRSSNSRTRTKPSRSPIRRSTASPPGSGRTTSGVGYGWPAVSWPAQYGSTLIGRSATRCLSVASGRAVTDVITAWRRSRSI